MEQYKLNSMNFVDTLRDLNAQRALSMNQIHLCYEIIRKEKSVVCALSAVSSVSPESAQQITRSLQKIEKEISKLGREEQKIRDYEEVLIQILELSVADCNLSAGISRRIDDIGEIYDKQGNVLISSDTALGATNVTISDMLVAQKVSEFFQIPINDINVVK